MFKHLLVPLDGSQLAEAALPPARFFAQCFGANVTLVHLIEKGRPKTVHEQPHLHDVGEAETYLAQAARSFPQGVSVDYHVHHEEVKAVAASIADHCVNELYSDLVIMCTHGEKGSRRFVQASIAQQVIAAGTVPVLAVHAVAGPAIDFVCDNVLLPLDGKQEHGDILGFAAPFATCCGASVRMISVVPTYETLPGKWFQVGRLLPGATAEMLDIEAEALSPFLEEQAEKFRKLGLAIQTAVLRGDPGLVISEDAQESHAALIIMATHGKSGMSALWEGSVASRVFADGRSALLLVPALANR
jgi:nucleotide-binding universal stress UspA family protein